MYDPKVARFLQEDTYRGNAADPLSLNLYTYCHNEPIMYYDPTGHLDEAAGNAYIQRNYSDLWKDLSGYGANWNKYNKKLQEIEQKLKKDPKNQSLKDKYNTALSDRNYWHTLADSLRADLEKRDPVYYNTRHGIPLSDYNKSGKNGGQGNNKSTTETGKSNSGNPTPPQNGTNPFVEFFKGLFTMNDAGKALVDDFNRRMMEVNAQDFLAIRNKYLSNEYIHGVDITNPEVQKEADKIALAMLMMGPSSNMELMTNMLSSQAISLQVQKWGQQYTDFFEGLDNVDVYKIIMNNNDPTKGTYNSARIPRTGAEWNEYFKSKYGSGNVEWVTELKSYDDIAMNPKALWGKSSDDVGKILGEGWTRGTYGSAGTGWKFTNGDKSVFYHPGGGVHEGSYVGVSSGQMGKVKVVGSDYKPLPGDKAIIIQK